MTAMLVPEDTDANSSAAAAPAPSPIKTICVIASCPALSAVRDGSRPSQPSAAGSIAGGLAICPRMGDRPQCPSLSDDIGQKSKKTCTLDRLGELALLLGRHGGDPARNDLPALRHVPLQQPHV